MLESALVAGLRGADAESKHCQVQARAQLFSPGQPMAMDLAKNPTALVVNRTLFAHGGVFPQHGEPAFQPAPTLLPSMAAQYGGGNAGAIIPDCTACYHRSNRGTAFWRLTVSTSGSAELILHHV